jgi:AcrR family transcriptional regulator
MARAYRLGKRAVTAAETRQRIIDAARDVIARSGIAGASLGLIATDAGVTRTTVYQQFGSKDELMLAVLNDALDRADVRAVRKALQQRDAGRAARLMLRASCRFWAGEYALFSKIKGLAGVDGEAAVLDANKEGVRQGHIMNLAHRLAEQGQLRPGVTESRAMQMLQLLSSYETFDHLHRIGGMRPDTIAALVIDMADRAVLTGGEG